MGSKSPESGGIVRAAAIVPSAGVGRRLGAGMNKTFVMLAGRPVVEWVLEALEQSPLIAEVIPVVSDNDRAMFEALVESCGFRKIRTLARGGVERQDSVRNALAELRANSSCGLITVQDGVRPFIDAALIERCLVPLNEFDGTVAAMPPKDTIKQCSDGRTISATLRRETLWSVQTPQSFRAAILHEAYDRAYAEGYYSTDDSALVERIGGRVKVVEGSYENIKVTTPEDMILAEGIMRARLARG